MEEFDLKSHHVSCIYYLYMQDGLTARELCDLCEEDKANISRALDFLEKQGYICRESVQKRYRSPLYLTEKGKAVGRRLADKMDKMLTLASEGLDEQSRGIMYRSLEIISRNLQCICDEYEAARHE
jgi:DNA-binding MarR family transcriptional regulator